jgi:hypothetical protein
MAYRKNTSRPQNGTNWKSRTGRVSYPGAFSPQAEQTAFAPLPGPHLEHEGLGAFHLLDVLVVKDESRMILKLLEKGTDVHV